MDRPCASRPRRLSGGARPCRSPPRSRCSCSPGSRGRRASPTSSPASSRSWSPEMQPATLTLDSLRHAATRAGAADVASSSPSGIRCRLPAWEIPTLADRLAPLGARCQFLAAADTRATGGDFTLAYVFAPPQLAPSVTVLVAVPAGIIEPGHFRFSVEGETIVNLETRLGFVHKGTEKLFEGLAFDRAPALAERISGDTSVGHVLAYCQALETLAGCTVPARAARLRVVLLELERIYNHVGDVGMIVNDTGFAFGHAHCFRIREELLRVNERLTGHRLLRGAVVPGGVAGPLLEASIVEAARDVTALVGELVDLAGLCLQNSMVLERLQGTGRLTTRTAREMQVV